MLAEWRMVKMLADDVLELPSKGKKKLRTTTWFSIDLRLHSHGAVASISLFTTTQADFIVGGFNSIDIMFDIILRNAADNILIYMPFIDPYLLPNGSVVRIY